MHHLRAFLALFLLCGSPAAEVYKWTDDNGVVQFSDKPPERPDGGQGVTEVELPRQAPAASGEAKGSGIGFGVSEQAKAQFRSPPKIELYTTRWCPYCEKARQFLRAKNIAFTEYDVEKDPAAARRKRELGSPKGVPFAVINGRKVQGYSEQSYVRALEGNP